MTTETYSAHKAETMNNQNKALGIDSYSVKACNDFRTLKAAAEALIRQLRNVEKGLENIERVQYPNDNTADIIHKMTTNYRHQSALLYEVEKRMYEVNPLLYTTYIKNKDKDFSYTALFYSYAQKTLFGWIFNMVDKKTKENFIF